jgi:hypothetical protein
MSNNKKKLFDREYLIRFGFICLIAIGLIGLAWTYKFRSNLIIPLNESNADLFKGKFAELSDLSQYGEYKEMNITLMGQKKAYVSSVDRSKYGINYAVFSNLPSIPDDWGKSKYAYDSGNYHVFKDIPAEYFVQPEFFDDWETIGLKYQQHAVVGCKNGFFANPNTQRIYTKRGATVETYVIFRASFCASRAQSFAPQIFVPASGMTYDGMQFIQNPKIIGDNVKLTFVPSGFVLGKTYPDFDPDWAQKAKVLIEVKDNLPRGIYVVSVVAGEYRPVFTGSKDIDMEAYKSKEGTPLVNFILAVD